MNVLVTGGAGYIGSHTCVELIETGHTPIVVDNLYNSSAKSLQRVEEITGKAVPFYQVDIRDREALGRVMDGHSFDACIHFAGLKAVGESVAKPWEYYDNNLNSTLVLTKVMTEVGLKKLIFSSDTCM